MTDSGTLLLFNFFHWDISLGEETSRNCWVRGPDYCVWISAGRSPFVLRNHMTERTLHLAGLWIGAAISNTSQSRFYHSNEHSSRVKDQGRQQCCHNKHKKYTWCICTFCTRPVCRNGWSRFCDLCNASWNSPVMFIIIIFNCNWVVNCSCSSSALFFLVRASVWCKVSCSFSSSCLSLSDLHLSQSHFPLCATWALTLPQLR
jgi:hypothetical protein